VDRSIRNPESESARPSPVIFFTDLLVPADDPPRRRPLATNPSGRKQEIMSKIFDRQVKRRMAEVENTDSPAGVARASAPPKTQPNLVGSPKVIPRPPGD